LDMQSQPLKGVKVIDLTTYVAAPAATCILGYLGADVIRVEPLKGDPYRNGGKGYGIPVTPYMDPIADTCNSYKRSISVDFRSEEGKEIIRKLVSTADIFVSNYRVEALRAMGFLYEDVSQLNPKIVYGHMNGFGDKGKDAPRPGFDAVSFFARSGFSMVSRVKNSVPMPSLTGVGDTISSMALAMGILAAYFNACRTGKGEKVTTSLYGSAIWVMGIQIALAQFGAKIPATWEEPTQMASLHDYHTSDDEWIRICCLDVARTWKPLCRALGIEEYGDDPRFNTSAAQHENRRLGVQLIQKQIEKHPYAYWEKQLVENDVPFERHHMPAQVADDEQARVNHYVERVEYPNGKEVYLAMPPFQFKNAGNPGKDRAPRLGEHTVQVLTEQGFSPDEIDALLAKSTVRQFEDQ